MANIAKGVYLLQAPSDTVQSSFEKTICLAQISGDSTGAAVMNFMKEDYFEDTLTGAPTTSNKAILFRESDGMILFRETDGLILFKE